MPRAMAIVKSARIQELQGDGGLGEFGPGEGMDAPSVVIPIRGFDRISGDVHTGREGKRQQGPQISIAVARPGVEQKFMQP